MPAFDKHQVPTHRAEDEIAPRRIQADCDYGIGDSLPVPLGVFLVFTTLRLSKNKQEDDHARQPPDILMPIITPLRGKFPQKAGLLSNFPVDIFHPLTYTLRTTRIGQRGLAQYNYGALEGMAF
jgi:hypothetical protein